MVDIASLAIQIDTSDVSRAERDLDRLGNKGAKSERAAKGVGDAHDKATGKVGALGTSARKTSAALDQGSRSAGAYAGKIAAMAAPLLSVAAAMAAIGKVASVQRQFDVLNAGLVTATGSAERAQEAFSALQAFARQTPYDLSQAVDGFTKLVNLGLTPSEKALRSYGNTASALGKDLNQMIEAVADASTGEFERLKEFGIKAKQNGDQVSLTFQGVTKSIGNNAAEIEKYLTDLGENQFAGAMTQRMATLDGAISNLGDSWDAFARNISNAGAGDLMEGAVRQAIDALDELNAQLESGQLEAQLGAISGKFDGWGGDIAQTLDIVGDIFESATGRWGALVDNNVENMTSTFANFPENVRAFIQLMTVEVLNGFDKVTAYSAAFKDGIKAIFTDDTMEGVGARLEADLQRLNELRDDSIASILEERDAALTSYSDQMSAAQGLRKVYDDAMERSAQATADRLAKFKALGSSAGAAGDAVEKLGKKLKNLDATGPGDAINDYIKQFEKLHDELNPAEVAAREYGKQQDLLNDIIARGGENADKARGDLVKLREQYEENTRETSQWVELTNDAFERVNQAGADMWFDFFDTGKASLDGLLDIGKRWAAEMMNALTMRGLSSMFGGVLGFGGSASALASGGSSGGGNGFDFGQLLNYGQTAYSMFTGVGPAVMAGWQSGGLTGAIQGGAGYYGNLASSAWNTASGWFGGGSAVQGGAGVMLDAGGNIVNYGAGGNLSGMLGNLGAIVGPIAGLYMAIKGYGAISDGYDFKPKDFDDEFAGVRLGAKVINAYENGITKVFGDSSFLSKALRIPVATIGGLMSSVFGGGWETKNYGLAFSVANGDFLGQSYEDQKKKGGLFGSDKKRTKYRNLDPETAAALQETYDATQAGVADLFASLSLTVEEGSLDGLQLARQKISTKGKTEEEIQQAIAEWFGSAADAMTAELNKVFNTGLDLDLEGMQAFVGNLQGVNEVLRYLDVEMYDASVAGGKLAEALSAAAGGLEALATNSQTYYSAFFSDAEKVEDTIDSIQRAFESADVELASSRQAYREMVEDIDLTTEAGREMFATLMALSGQAATYYDILEGQLLGAANNAYAALQRSIANQQQEIQRAASSTASAINALTGVSNSLDAALKRLRGSSDDAVRMLRAQAVMTLNSALVTARAGGSLADYAGLQDALDVASNMDTSLYRSLEDFEREQGRTANLIAELEKVNGKQLSAEEQMLEQYEKQLAGLDQQLAFAQAQLDALNGIDNSIMGVAAAIAAMNASVVAALQGLPKGAAQANTPQNNRSIVDSIYQSVLGRGTEGDEAGAAFWANALQSGTATYQDIAASIAKGALGNSAESAATKKSAEEYLKGLGIPGFASGGYTGRGDKYDPAGIVHKGEVVWSQSDIAKWGGVGAVEAMRKDGPELEVTGPSRIYNASQTAAMLGGAGSTEELRALRGEVAGLYGALHSIAKHTEKTATGIQQIKDIGIPQEEVA